MKEKFPHRHECGNCGKSYRCDRVTEECAITKISICDPCMEAV